jgi:peptide methionine sulfoxide reductase MsrB
MKLKNISKGILILLISVPLFAGNSKFDAGKNCPAMMKCIVEKAVEENFESIIQPADLATTVMCRFLIN